MNSGVNMEERCDDIECDIDGCECVDEDIEDERSCSKIEIEEY